MKKCPFCSEEIQDTAIKCRFCWEFLNQESKKNISVDIDRKKADETSINIKNGWLEGLYIVPVWKFILYNVLSFWLYHLGYLSMLRISLQKDNKIPVYTGIKNFFWFNRWFSTKLITWTNESLKERWINKKVSSILITILYWVLLVFLIISVKEIDHNQSILPVYIFALFLSLSLIPLVYTNNKYLAEINPNKSKKNLFWEIVLVLIWIFILVGSFYWARENQVNSFLTETTTELNKKLPMNIDSETRIDSVSVLPNNTIWYQYTLLNIEKSSANIEEMKQEKQKSIFDWMKVNTQSKVMFDKNISMNFSFLDKNWEFLFDVILSPEMFKWNSN